MNRRDSIAVLMDFLAGLLDGATVRWRRRGPGSDWPNSRRWPLEATRRERMRSHLTTCFEREDAACVVEVWGDEDESPALFDLPASQGSLPFPGSSSATAAGLRPLQNGQTDRIDAPATARKPAKASKVQVARICLILYHEQRRLTAPQILEALAARGIEVSSSLVEATCSWMVAEKVLTSGRDGRGRGYGLSRWDQKPAEEEEAEEDGEEDEN